MSFLSSCLPACLLAQWVRVCVADRGVKVVRLNWRKLLQAKPSVLPETKRDGGVGGGGC